jgi:hypothetical protein
MDKMEPTKQIDLTWLIPEFSKFTFLPQNGAELSTLFIALLIAVAGIFSLTFLFHFFKTQINLSWLKKQLKGLNRDNILHKRDTLFSAAKSKEAGVGHLWLEFDETLVEVKTSSGVLLRNTLDAGHFFNTHTLAKQVTENRLIAAVPGFLTAIGVIGTFVGLQLGLAGLNLGAGASVGDMQIGISNVVDGAKVAFLTSVWGVALSVLFNFGEKWLEQRIRNRIRRLEDSIDRIFPRIRPEDQLQVIAENGAESRETLQGLAEKIGDKMQEAMVTATQGIQSSLEKSLSEIMAPAINKLVDETSQGNQKALEGLLQRFMDGFGAQGTQQRQALDDVSSKVNDSVDAMRNSMTEFVNQLKHSQLDSGEREKELISSISNHVSQLVEQSNGIGKQLTNFVEQQVSGLSNTFAEREQTSARREQELVVKISEQVSELVNGSRVQGEMLTSFVEKQINGLSNTFADREQTSARREQELVAKISEQVSELVAGSREQGEMLTSFVEKQVSGLSNTFAEREQTSARREQELVASISEQVTELVTGSREQGEMLTSFVEKQVGELSSTLEKREQTSAQREQELVSRISEQVSELVTGSREQGEMLTNFVKEQLSEVVESFNGREERTALVEQKRAENIETQSIAIGNLTSELIASVEKTIKYQVQSASALIEQGKSLQTSVESSVHASAQTSQAMKESATELRVSAESMRTLSSHLSDAGNKLSNAIKDAVDSTRELSQQNQLSAVNMEKLRTQLMTDVGRFDQLTVQLTSMLSSAESTFGELKTSHRDFITQFKSEVGSLSSQMTTLLEDYASQANATTAEHLKVWSDSVTQYSTQMTSAVKALSNVVDTMEEKLE